MQKGWLYKTFCEHPPLNYRLISAPTTQHIYLPDGFCDELKHLYDKSYYEMFVLGKTGDYNSNLVVKDFPVISFELTFISFVYLLILESRQITFSNI